MLQLRSFWLSCFAVTVGCAVQAPKPTIQDFEATIHRNPFVRHVRNMLDRAEQADREACAQTGLVGIDPQTCPGFVTLAHDHAGEKLLLLEAHNAIGGGLEIAAVFRGHPENVYYAWVYQGAEGDFELRAFQPMSVGDQEYKRAMQLYQSALDVERWWF